MWLIGGSYRHIISVMRLDSSWNWGSNIILMRREGHLTCLRVELVGPYSLTIGILSINFFFLNHLTVNYKD